MLHKEKLGGYFRGYDVEMAQCASKSRKFPQDRAFCIPLYPEHFRIDASRGKIKKRLVKNESLIRIFHFRLEQ